MRYLSLFSGIESASLAFEPLGWTPVAFAEIDPFACAVLSHRYPQVPNLGDITKVKWEDYRGSIDLVVGGSPCQSFSIAGLRRGLDDPRGNLTLTFLQVLDRVRPRWMAWENVPGILSDDGGRTFGTFIGALAELGFSFAWRVLDAQYLGLAQRRQRVFLVGYSGAAESAPAAVLFERESLSGHPPPRREARQVASPLLGSGAGTARTGNETEADYLVEDHDVRGVEFRNNVITGDITGTLQAHKSSYSLNSIPSILSSPRDRDQGYWVDDDVSGTLRSDGGDCGGGSESLLATPILEVGARQDTTGDSRDGLGVGKPGDPMFTLQSSKQHGVLTEAFGGNNTSGAIDVSTAMSAHGGPHGRLDFKSETFVVSTNPTIPFTVHGEHSTAMTGNGDAQVAFESDTARSLDTTGGYATNQGGTIVAQGISENQRAEVRLTDVSRQMTTGGGKPGQGYPAVLCFQERGREGGRSFESQEELAYALTAPNGGSRGQEKNIATGAIVRRLTPTECEKLQGLPVGWTDVPYRGKPATDGPRYKAIGNAMAVPVMRWIGQRIQKVEDILSLQEKDRVSA